MKLLDCCIIVDSCGFEPTLLIVLENALNAVCGTLVLNMLFWFWFG